MKTTSDSKEAREMYAEMFALHHDIIEKLETDPKSAAQLLGRFCDEAYGRWQLSIQTGRYNYDTMFNSRGDVTLFFFAASDPNLPNTTNLMNRGQMLLNAPRIANALSESGADASPTFKKIFLSWLENEKQPYMQSRGFQIASNANMKEALPVARKLLSKKELAGYNQAQLMIAFVKFADKDCIKDLEPYVDNKTVVTTVNFGNGGGQKTVQVGDVALGVIMQLAGQKPADFGYDARGNASVMASSYIYYGFGNDKERADARTKWAEWMEKNRKK